MVARVMYDYEARDEGELTIKEGNILLITDDTDQDWWEAVSRPIDTFDEGKKGLVPLTYVEEVRFCGKTLIIMFLRQLERL